MRYWPATPWSWRRRWPAIRSPERCAVPICSCGPTPPPSGRGSTHVSPWADVSFTRDAWSAVGGFPEHLATGEDVSFGLAVSRTGECVASTDAVVGWTQRVGLAATWRMYRGYGRASTGGGDLALLVRDGVRGLAYLLAPLLALRSGTRRLVAAGVVAYLSLPVLRTVEARGGPGTFACLPLALATKDLGKLVGAWQGFSRRRGGAG